LIRNRAAILLLLAAFLPLASRAQFPPAPGTGPGLPETTEAIDSARVTTRILYVTAHPDDESGAVLSYLSRGLHADTALLSITRGEGGQNALGPEQAPQLGLIRTQELLAATRGYGAKLYFTRAKDFGFSKTPEETEKIWGDPVLEDMVRVIREFRPNIVINGWGGVHTGHGHHQLSGIWTPEAVKLAADPNYLADANLPAWDNKGSGVRILDVERGSENPKGYALPVDEVSPLYGKSYREIGLDAFVNHRTQGITGFINSPFLRRPLALLPEDGGKLDPATLAVGLAARTPEEELCNCEAHLKAIDRALEDARASVLKFDWPAAVNSLVAAEKAMKALSSEPIPAKHGAEGVPNRLWFLGPIQRKLDRALQLAAGISFSADADRSDVAAGDPIAISVRSRCRQEISCKFGKITVDSAQVSAHTSAEGGDAGEGRFKVELQPKETRSPLTEPPYFVGFKPSVRPEPAPLLTANRQIEISGYPLACSTTVSNTTATSTSVSRVPIRLVPAYTLKVDPDQSVAVLSSTNKPFSVYLRVHSYSTKAAKVTVGLETPDGFTASPPVEVPFGGVGDQYAKLTVTPPAKLVAGNYTITAYAKRGDEKFSITLEPLPTVPTILWGEPAQTVVHAFDIDVPANLRVGYISAEGEMIPDALRRLGISVEMLDANALTFGDLSTYSAIVVGVRAYELRPELASANKRLLDYVSNGGTLIVQYNRDFIWNKFLPAPYPATIGNPTPRITDENAEVKFLTPGDRLLNWPNKITQGDFKNWVQERGLYYWSDFDPKYTPLLSMHDPGERDLTGGLVYTPFGKGTYIYTGLAFFRELPEGVPGAYRLFVNLLSASQSVR